jgi:hypothetical protein
MPAARSSIGWPTSWPPRMPATSSGWRAPTSTARSSRSSTTRRQRCRDMSRGHVRGLRLPEPCAYVASRPSDTELNPHGLWAGGGSPVSDVRTSARCLKDHIGRPAGLGCRTPVGRPLTGKGSTEPGQSPSETDEPTPRRPPAEPRGDCACAGQRSLDDSDCRVADAVAHDPVPAHLAGRRSGVDQALSPTPRVVQPALQRRQPGHPVQHVLDDALQVRSATASDGIRGARGSSPACRCGG